MSAVNEGRKNGIRRLLKGIETGDPTGIEVINPELYIQHNPQTQTSREGLAALFERLSKTSPRVNLVRVFSDGDFVFAHTEYDFSTRRIGFEVFRFEGDSAVEHWDNIQPRRGPNPSGRSMVDGPTEATDLELTEANRALVGEFIQQVLIGRDFARFGEWVDGGLVQHDPELTDGLDAWRTAFEATTRYERNHRILAEGSFVLAVNEGYLGDVHTAFCDLFRVESGRLAERWNTVEAVPPPETWKNDNGKF